MVENFFGIMKSELLCAEKFYTVEDFKKSLEEYINYCNNIKNKNRLNTKSPV